MQDVPYATLLQLVQHKFAGGRFFCSAQYIEISGYVFNILLYGKYYNKVNKKITNMFKMFKVDNSSLFCYNALGGKRRVGVTISLEVPRTQGLKRVLSESCNILPREF